MKKLFIIMGKSFSGKTTLLNKLDLPILVTTTTRPKRDYEIDDKDYHFISDEQFKTLSDKEKIGLRQYKVYDNKLWYYFLSSQELINFNNSNQKEAVLIVDYEGYLNIAKLVDDLQLDIQVIGVYLDVSIKQRLHNYLDNNRQNENAQETIRRFYSDEFINKWPDDNLLIHKFNNIQDAYKFIK